MNQPKPNLIHRLRSQLRDHVTKQTPRQIFLDYLLITIGCVLMALTNNAFWVPNRVVSGGVSGLGIIANYLWGLPVGMVMLTLNIPLFLAGLRWGGGITTGIRTIYATVVLSLAIDLTAPYVPSPTSSPLLYITYGSIIDGIAMGLIFRAQATTGGTDIVGRLLKHFFGLEISRGVFIANALTTLAAIIVLGLEKAMYGVMVAALNAWVIDVVLAGGRRARQVIIISNEWGSRSECHTFRAGKRCDHPRRAGGLYSRASLRADGCHSAVRISYASSAGLIDRRNGICSCRCDY